MRANINGCGHRGLGYLRPWELIGLDWIYHVEARTCCEFSAKIAWSVFCHNPLASQMTMTTDRRQTSYDVLIDEPWQRELQRSANSNCCDIWATFCFVSMTCLKQNLATSRMSTSAICWLLVLLNRVFYYVFWRKLRNWHWTMFVL